MKSHLSSFEYVLWAVQFFAQLALAFVIAVRKLHRTLPLLAAYIYLSIAQNIACFVVSQASDIATYAYTNFSLTVLAYSLLAGFLWYDIYAVTFGPRRSLPDWVWKRVSVYVSGIYAFMVVTAALPDVWLNWSFPFLSLAIRALTHGLLAAALVIIFYSLHLKIWWRQDRLLLICGLAFNLMALLSVSYAQYWLPRATGGVLRTVYAVADALTLCVWFRALLLPCPDPEPLTEEQIEVLEQRYKQIESLSLTVLDEA